MTAPTPSAPKTRHIHPAVFVLPSVAIILSFFMTWATLGFGPDFLVRWARSFVTTLVVLPVVLVTLGSLEKLLNTVIGGLPLLARKLILAVVTSCLIETVIGFAVTAVSHGFDASFTHYWWLAFSRALPAGLCIGAFMAFYMKPKMDAMHQAAKLRAVAA